MTRLNIVLFLALVASGLYLVKVSYQARHLFVEVEKAQAEQRALDTEFEQLTLEKRTQATPLRVEKIAREKLNMRTASAVVTHYVTYEEAPPAAAASAPEVAAGGAGP
jgi:cell division protein FtsL